MVLQEKEKHVYLAKLSEQAERYDEMKDYMKKVACACADGELSVEERNLLSVAYKNAVGSRRASWRILSNTETKEMSKRNNESAELARGCRLVIEEELSKICGEILDLLKTHLIEQSSSGESKVFYYKMQGDYYRYIAEFSKNTEVSAELAETAYQKAMEFAEKELPVTHPIRLGLALNFSVFYFEVLKNSQKACQMAREAFEHAMVEIDEVAEDSYKDSTLIMQLLRDNLTLWTPDQEDGEEQKN